MAEKQRGRPKRTTNAETNEIGQSEKTEAKETKLAEKVIEKKAPEVAKPQRPQKPHPKTHTVYVKGRAREMSKLAYEAVVKDLTLEVTLPKGSALVEPTKKPCKDC